jgi:hypothetical protein
LIDLFRQVESNMTNPFGFGNPVRGEAFFDRRRETSRLVDGILKGNSEVITAEPRAGKTSLLYRIHDASLYGATAARLHFRYLNAQTITGWNVPHFWEYALQPVKELSPAVLEAYRSAALEKFGTFVVERVLLRLDESGERLVLLLDEFDTILEEPGLHKAEFYGGLRALATRFSSLVLVIASRQPLEDLNRRTQEFSRSASPYFNFLEEISLGVFPLKETAALLARAGTQFDSDDRVFLERVSGGHPYFLQSSASYLWDAPRRGDADARRYQAGQQCFQQAIPTLKDIWRLWTPYQQMAFTLAALDAMPLLLPDRHFDLNRLLKDRPNFAPEQRILKNRGFLRPDSALDSGYAPQGEIMLWFLAEELTRLLRPQDPDLAKWLRDQQWEGLLKHGEKESLKNALQSLKPILKDGALAFIKAAAEGLGKGLAGS